MEYKRIAKSSELVHSLTVDTLDKLARAWFEDKYDYPLNGSLPDRGSTLTYAVGPFSMAVSTKQKDVYNFHYKNRMISERRICEEMDQYIGMGEELKRVWRKENPNRRPHEALWKVDDMMEKVADLRNFVFENPTLEDFVTAIEHGHPQNAARMLNEDFDEMFNPGGDHELNGLFTNGDVHVIYQDEEVALLKPEYNHAAQARVHFGRNVVVQNVSEAAYVVGVDDTPTGLFGHVVDGTNLDYDQEVTKRQIRDVMDFDWSYHGEERLEVKTDERIRLQGDLAIRKTGRVRMPDQTPGSQCNLPIDNHLVVIGGGFVIGGRDEEPIKVQVPEPTRLSVLHDEHENVNCRLSSGEYELYLLPRGIQDEHPSW